ncbi:hypothetical protein [Kribbella caucasensis]|uniref:hypothetical protein n=1 Tax=Kribbella caucasensis TaxID=2512215 RepID=UPI001414DD97|nr:hypothetical protein [Kribbella sp. VKM Ac-2527]
MGATSAGRELVADHRVDVISSMGGPATVDRIAACGLGRKLLMEQPGRSATLRYSVPVPGSGSGRLAG